MSTAITDAITTLAEAEAKFQLTRTEDEDFFREYYVDLPTLTKPEKHELMEMRRRYLYQRSQGHLLERTVILLFASPLLTLAGFYDPPFRVKAEESIQLVLEDPNEILQGRLDILVLKDRVWVVVLESKKTALSVWTALPQTLAYLAANSYLNKPSYALMTNGDESVFVKVDQANQKLYTVSRSFTTQASIQELYATFRGLKGIARVVRED